IIVPCHRIIGSDGKLVGYAGGLDVKKKLLQLEACTAGNDVMTQSMELF
ncbi:MAG: MGMT family protein, partial [Pseudomonadales bacterium]|nr:MGMT family protein [Pseudomonadales bacterium]